MKKINIILFTILLSVALKAQQETQYTQFTLNNYGFNPAVAGSANGLFFLVGKRTQWRGFDGGPNTEFANVTCALGKKGYKHFWHGIGAYVEQDKFGVYTNKTGYLSYAIHLKASAKYRIGFGVAAGVRSVALSNIVFDMNDPVFAEGNKAVVVPDIIPGIYMYSKKFSLAISVRNLYKNELKFGGKQLGSGIDLLPTAYITLTRKFISHGYNFITIPAINLQTNFRNGVPSVNLDLITYYKKRVGFGINYRVHDALSAVLQVRVYKNLIIGIAYDLTVSRFHAGKANSDEIMIGYSPLMSTEDLEKQHTADCPKFEVF